MNSVLKGFLFSAFATSAAMAEEQQPVGELYIYAVGGSYRDPVTEAGTNTKAYWLYKFDGFPSTMDEGGEHDNLRLRGHMADPETGECLPVYSVEGEVFEHYQNSRIYAPEILPPLSEANGNGRAMQIGQVYGEISDELRAEFDSWVSSDLWVQSSDNRDLYFSERLFSGTDDEYVTDSSFETGKFHGIPYAQIWIEIQKAESNRVLGINTSDDCTKFDKPQNSIVIG